MSQARYPLTVLPLTSINPDSNLPTPATISKIGELTHNRAVWARSLVDFDPPYEPLATYLFGGFFVVDSIDTALRLNNLFRYPCVTLAGDKVSPSGTLEGGWSPKQSWLLEVSELQGGERAVADA